MNAPSAPDELELISPAYYAEHGYPHDAYTRLRREAPISWFDRTDVPFWAVMRHADIVTVSRQPRLFESGPRFQLFPGAEQPEWTTIISMDPPKHGVYRQLTSRRFTPRALAAIAGEIERVATEIVEGLGKDGSSGECDFVDRVAAPLPIAVIAWLLGLPADDWQLLYRWTNEVVGLLDPEYQREGETPIQTRQRASEELFAYFAALAEERRKSPRNDLVSALVLANVDGEPLGRDELLAYYLILVAAGNETTRNATSSGLMAFAENRDEWSRLRSEPELLPSAVEEVLRWTTPVIQMARTATEDTELAGTKIRSGETLALFYPSANRDEAVFAEPFRFRIDRAPNRHLAFGIGEHFCLGAHLARLELQAAFRLLSQRMVDFEITGPVDRLQSSAVGGVKRLPIRYELTHAG
jgi:cholest-4-en-3-one 26-monooxygenase